jgi:hypothetical protein
MLGRRAALDDAFASAIVASVLESFWVGKATTRKELRHLMQKH